jgi:hypothetical protein
LPPERFKPWEKNVTSLGSRKAIGVVAISLLVLFTIFGILRVFSFEEWLIADVVVALVANLALRVIGRRRQ